jgi:glycine/D-amino acid oxidase-like deaminating enzyme
VRAAIVGGGLAGSLLAWRLARVAPTWAIDLIREPSPADATAASGGAVRAYEADAEQRQLAIDSLLELRASPVLRRWAGYRELEAVYVPEHPVGVGAAVEQIDQALPDSVRTVAAHDFATLGWAPHPGDVIAVAERRAGRISPSQLRHAVLADAPVRRGVRVIAQPLRSVADHGGDPLGCTLAGSGERRYDVVVLAAGAWTGQLLAASGWPADAYRTKAIQYALHPVRGWRPSQFVDEPNGLYGLPVDDGALLLGVPTRRWGVDPDRPGRTLELAGQAARLAEARFPRLRLGPPRRIVGAADCYVTGSVLALRPVSGSAGRLYTFTGGSGGAAKTALAASQRAATELVDAAALPELAPTGLREVTP